MSNRRKPIRPQGSPTGRKGHATPSLEERRKRAEQELARIEQALSKIDGILEAPIKWEDIEIVLVALDDVRAAQYGGTQSEFADVMLDIEPSTYNNIVNGRAIPRLKTFMLILDALNYEMILRPKARYGDH